jgi:hypothetical protein
MSIRASGVLRTWLLPVLVGCGLQGISNEALVVDTAFEPDEVCVSLDMPEEAPDCDCGSYMPLCVGARWDYLEPDTSDGTVPWKQQKIVGYGDPGAAEYGKSGYSAFYYERYSVDNTKTSWITAAEGEVCWQFDHRYDPEGSLTKTRIYDPARLRIDLRRILPGDSWRERFTETVYENGEINSVQFDLVWTVSTMEHLSAQVAGYQIDYQDLLCQERIGVGPTSKEDPEHKLFCFVQGIGKVYEWDFGKKEEFLVGYEIPGCSATLPDVPQRLEWTFDPSPWQQGLLGPAKPAP